MTPAELNKSLTILLNELLEDTGFQKKRIMQLKRKVKECEQFISFYFTRERDNPGNHYFLTITRCFSFPKVNQLTCEFLGQEYTAALPTGTKPLYAVVPDRPVLKYKYCSDEPLSQLAEIISKDFHTYALPFYEKYDTLDKLEIYFEQILNHKIDTGGFIIVRTGEQGKGWGVLCCRSLLCFEELG